MEVLIFLTVLAACSAAVLGVAAYRLGRQLKAEREARSIAESGLSAMQVQSEHALSRAHVEAEQALSQARLEAERQLSLVKAEVAAREAQLKAVQEESARMREEMEERFRGIASSILMESTETLQRHNNRGLSEALAPVKENFEQFRKTFAERTERDTAERAAMAERVKDLMNLNATIGRETRRLTDALKGNSRMQGQWGEMILNSILEHCGLKEGREFYTQKTLESDGGKIYRPDVVINYTEGRKIVVDSKVSIQAYLRMLDADTEEARTAFGREHVLSVRKHIAELKGKSYQELVGSDSIDFVLMFIPHEGAYMAAMQLSDDLWESAYAANVLIVSPTHLMGVVRLVEQMWRNDRQERNAREIARQASMMLEKFNAFLADLDKIDKSIRDSRSAWDEAFRKLSGGTGNLISRATRLMALGVKSKKQMPQRYITEESDPQAETAAENELLQE